MVNIQKRRSKSELIGVAQARELIVNYTPDGAVQFDLEGNPVEHFYSAYIPEQVEVFIGKAEAT